MKRFQFIRQLSVKDWLLIFFGIVISTGLFFAIGTNTIFFQFTVLLLLTWLTLFVLSLNKQVQQLQKDEKPMAKVEMVQEIDMEETVRFKEKELTKIELDKTILFEELLSKATLKEEEKQRFRERLSQKEHEAKTVYQELTTLKSKLQKVVKDGAALFLKRDSAVYEVVELLGAEFIIHQSYDDINSKLKRSYFQLEDEVTNELIQAQFMTHDYTLTRMGYRELVKEAKKGKVMK